MREPLDTFYRHVEQCHPMISETNTALHVINVTSDGAAEYPNLTRTTYQKSELSSLIPNFTELWDHTKDKVIAAGAVSISIYGTHKLSHLANLKPNALVAIVVPTFNVEDFILETLSSIKVQTYTPLHIIVVDDNSTDSTKDKILQFASAESDNIAISFVQIPTNIGNPGFTRNFGLFNLLLPNTEYIAFMDGDDVYAADNVVEILVAALDPRKAAIAAVGDYDWVSEVGKPLARATSIQTKSNGQVVWKKSRQLSWQNFARGRLGPYHLQCLMVRNCAPYIPYRPRGEDAEYFMRLFAECSRNNCELCELILEVPMLVAHYRKHRKSISQTNNPAFSPVPPPRTEKSGQQGPNIPPLYIVAQIPAKFITDQAISEWETRRLTLLFFRDLWSRGFHRALTHVSAALKHSRIRKTDLIKIPILHLWATGLSIDLIGRFKANTTSYLPKKNSEDSLEKPVV